MVTIFLLVFNCHIWVKFIVIFSSINKIFMGQEIGLHLYTIWQNTGV